jgi:hypothetical protein
MLFGELDKQDRIDIWLGVYTMLNMSCDLKSNTVSSATVGAHPKWKDPIKRKKKKIGRVTFERSAHVAKSI